MRITNPPSMKWIPRIFQKRSIWFAGVLLAVVFACGGCEGWNIPPDAKDLKNPVAANAATLAGAQQLYADNCAKCHGARGDGKVPPGATYFYSTKPTDFTNARLVDNMSDGEIFWKMTNGRKPMPAFKSRLSDEQRWDLVNLIRAFAHPAGAPAEK